MVPAFRLEWWLVSWRFLAGRLGPLFLFALLGDLADEHAADVVLLVPLVGLVEHVGRVLHQVRLSECLGCLDGGHGERVADLDVLAAAEGLEAGERLTNLVPGEGVGVGSDRRAFLEGPIAITLPGARGLEFLGDEFC